jgi:hypothetical protein
LNVVRVAKVKNSFVPRPLQTCFEWPDKFPERSVIRLSRIRSVCIGKKAFAFEQQHRHQYAAAAAATAAATMSKPDETVKVVVRIRPMSSEEERNGNVA